MPKGVYPHTHIKPKDYPEALVERVRTLYGGGASQAEVAASVGVSQKVVWRLMSHHGIPRRPQVIRDQRGSRNAGWKGDDAGYQAFHLRVERKYGQPRQCSVCGMTDPALTYDWANLTGNYPDPDDYARMCRSCHRKYDHSRKGVIANAR